MFTKEELRKYKSSWILPNGEIMCVPAESHDDNLPSFCQSIQHAENTCVKVSCCWDFDAPISEIYLPDRLTIYQAQALVKINDSLIELENINIEKKINRFYHHVNWSEILEAI